jgi:hypothetical protein
MWKGCLYGGLGRALAAKQEEQERRASNSGDATYVGMDKLPK